MRITTASSPYRSMAAEMVRLASEQAKRGNVDARKWLLDPNRSAIWIEGATRLDYDTCISLFRQRGVFGAAA